MIGKKARRTHDSRRSLALFSAALRHASCVANTHRRGSPERPLPPFRAPSVVIIATLAWLASAPPSPARAQASAAPSTVIATFGPHATEIADAARQFGLSPTWLHAIMQTESGGVAAARSPKGAIGLMQLMPDTYADMQRALGLGPDPWRPSDNLLAGAGYLRMLTDRYGASGALAAYNAGPGRYERWLSGSVPLPSETRAYVARVHSKLQSRAAMAHGHSVPNARKSPLAAPLFPTSDTASAQLESPPSTSSRRATADQLNPLFAPITTKATAP